MQTMKSVIFTATAIAALGLGGCATKDFVREQVSSVDAKVAANQSATQASLNQHQATLDQQQAQLAKVDQATQDALNRATAAGKLAEGKFLYSMVLSDDSVKFPVDSAKLSKEAEERLASFVDKLKTDNRNVYVEVQGHTDAKGAKDFNYKLGEERAEAVRRYLNQHGVALNRVNTISYGPDAPVAPNVDKIGRQANRRVVLIVLA